MPHINRIRLVDVAFNDAKSFYDDFLMVLNGKSVTFDLENGGGKSVLLMMMLQVVLPNTSLREDKPLKNIFLGGKDRTSHVLIEWKLDEGSQDKYLLTGFCARKSRSNKDDSLAKSDLSANDEDLEMSGGGVEYYNYFYLYNAPNEHDIKSLQLCTRENDKKRTMSYDQLKDIIRQLDKKGSQIGYFDRRGEYIDFIKMYNLIDTEWKIIKEINSGENSIEKYFRQNKTTRKLIENLLIKIIEDTESQEATKALGDKTTENNLADTLIEIRENLNKFLKDKQHLNEYSQILEFYNKIKATDESLVKDFTDLEGLRVKVVMNLNKIVNMIDALKTEKCLLEEKQSKTFENLKSAQIEKECLEIQLLDFEKASLSDELCEITKQNAAVEEEKDACSEEYRLCNAQNEYLKYKDELHKLSIAKNKLENLDKDAGEIYREYRVLGYNYKAVLQKIIQKLQQDMLENEETRLVIENQRSEVGEQLQQVNVLVGAIDSDIKKLDEIKRKSNKELNVITHFFREQGRIDIVMSPKEWHDRLSININEEAHNKQVFINNKELINDAFISDNNKLVKLQGDIELIDERLKAPINFINEYNNKKAQVDKLSKLYDVAGNEDDLEGKLIELSAGIKNAEVVAKMEYSSINKKLEVFDKYGYYVPNEEMIMLKEKLKKKYSHVFLGIELLQREDEETKRDLISINELLPYSIILDHDGFNKLKENIGAMKDEITGYPVPIIDIEAIRAKQKWDSKDVIFWSGEKNIFISDETFNQFKASLKQKSEALSIEISSITQKLHELDADRNELSAFKLNFKAEYVQSKLKEIEDLRQNKESVSQQIKKLEVGIRDNKEKIQEIEGKIKALQHQIEQLEEAVSKISEMIKLNHEITENENNLKQAVINKKQSEDERQKLKEKAVDLEARRQALNESINDLKIKESQNNSELQKLASFEETEILDLQYEVIKSKYEALHEVVQSQNLESEGIRKEINSHERHMQDYEERIIQNGFEIKAFIQKEEQGVRLTDFSSIYLSSLKKQEKELADKIKELSKIMKDIGSKIDKLDGAINTKIQTLFDNSGHGYSVATGLSSEQQIIVAIEDAKLMVKLFEGDKKKYEKQLKDMQSSIDELSLEQRDIMNFIDAHKIDIKLEQALEEVIPYDKLNKEHNSIEENINDKRKAWDRTVKRIIAQAQTFYISDPIKMLEELEAPDSLCEAEIAVKQLGESVEIINEQMRKVAEDIDVLQSYQEEFNRQCIQRAEWMLEKLKKLPSLSRIELNGTTRNMIEARFIDYSEEEKDQRMKNHIHNIVRDINEENEVDRGKIASRLSSKELLAQVTDMDKASIRLYKVESIEEHSGYKRWEYAVGSEGQSNALYFIFAVCLVAYIRMLSLNNTSMQSKKVIIVDNPFGATSAVYLWEPMFNILKENDVQLIAPGHRISKELTSKFEVNYLLNQEILSDNRMKVVVKDIRTEEDLEQMNFNALEQVSLW